jgi:outer membrane protein OmpA-like peptidoglycan-associated protein
MLDNENMHVVVDSSRFIGYIVDVVVTSRDYAQKNYDVVRDLLGSYFIAAYHYRQQMDELVLEDAKRLKQPLQPEQAQRLVEGIRWKNTQENFAHFGLLSDAKRQHIEDMIGNITKVLLQTNGIERDPTDGRATLLFYDRVLSDLQDSNFHPGLSSETIDDEVIKLPALSNQEWNNLREVGELKVRRLVFARGTNRLTASSYRVLDDLVKTLNTWPQYYVQVRGNASTRGDLEANRVLAENRARVAADYLIQQGIDSDRIRAEGSQPSGETSVSFLVGEAPY